MRTFYYKTAVVGISLIFLLVCMSCKNDDDVAPNNLQPNTTENNCITDYNYKD